MDGVTVTLASVDGVTVTFALFCSPLLLINLAVGFTANIKECYVTPLQTVMTCSCAAAISGRRGVKWRLVVGEQTVKVNCLVQLD